MGQVTYIEASGASHTIDLPAGENVMPGAQYNGADSCRRVRSWRADLVD